MSFKTIIKLMDIKTLVAGIVPVILGSVYSRYAFGPLPISYTPMGEIVSGITMGIGITTTVIYIHSGVLNLNTVLVAVPTSLFIGTILLSNNLSDIEEDRKAGRKTLPILIGVKNAEKLWVFNVIMLLGLTFALLLIGLYPIVVLVTVSLLFPYKSIYNFLSYDKSIYTKGRTMGLIGKVGLKYHLAVITGLLISIYI
ncbi:UbiA family prenyltransferase [Clostridium sp. DJ247]|uniref:UbiA family prenyltransferase n=1 Tax=Clostridium sp. DJ247 TaxID=2726188 RepID=UPI001626B494|nr:UbiA family prenyltransferase [Clostridium sp. DJ247]MBC2582045.1 UbiA family prenyltransferase [Clostridium sp. DJ247]